MNFLSSLAVLLGLYALAGAIYGLVQDSATPVTQSSAVFWLIIAVAAFVTAIAYSWRLRRLANRDKKASRQKDAQSSRD